MEEKQGARIAVVYEWLDATVFALAAVLLLFSFVLKSYIVSGQSMDPTLKDGDRVFVWSLFYTPRSGDIIVVDDNNGYNEPLVKRVVAVGGQTVEIDPDTLEFLVDGVPLQSPVAPGSYNLLGDTQYPLTVPEGYIFAVGDNRAYSLDSRYDAIGFIDARSVLGKEFICIAR
ncbi:MAG: signal peptidase I [Oscillospiraceae bacterium]|nr:signal peptidase I [Oscillospiraceae bacterium]